MNELKTRVNDNLFTQVKKFCSDMSEDVGKKVSVAQGIRWILESFFGIKVIGEEHYPKKSSKLVGPEKDLAEALGKIDELSTQLRQSEERREDFENQTREGTSALLASIQINGKSSLKHAVDLVVQELESKDAEIENLKTIKHDSYKYGEGILTALGLSISEDDEASYNLCIDVIGRNKKQLEKYNFCIREFSKILGRKDAMQADMHTREESDAFLKDLENRILSKVENLKNLTDVFGQILEVLEVTQSEEHEGIIGNNIPEYIKGLHNEVGSLKSQRDEFETHMHNEVDSNNRLLEKVSLYRGELRDYLSVLSVYKHAPVVRRIFGFGNIKDNDREWALVEIDRIEKNIDQAVRPPQEE